MGAAIQTSPVTLCASCPECHTQGWVAFEGLRASADGVLPGRRPTSRAGFLPTWSLSSAFLGARHIPAAGLGSAFPPHPLGAQPRVHLLTSGPAQLCPPRSHLKGLTSGLSWFFNPHPRMFSH